MEPISPTLVKKTLDEHKAYVEGMCRVSLFYARRWLRERDPEKPLGELLRDHAPMLYHGLCYYDHETKWDNLDCGWIIAKANELQALPPAEFEERMYAEIKPLAMERAERYYHESVGIGMPKAWTTGLVGSLKYDPPKSGLPSNYCVFHIANALAPRSIFDDPRHLPESFLGLMDKGAEEFGFDTLYTSTWLNDTPRWLALFPEEWQANLSPYPPEGHTDWHFGYWGQLVTARGTFNEKAGQHVRGTGAPRYRPRNSHCSFTAMRKHIAGLLEKIGTIPR